MKVVLPPDFFTKGDRMRAIACFLLAVAAMSAIAADVATKKKLAPFQVKSELETISFEPNVAWTGQKTPENARVSLFVNQFIGDGKEPLTSIMANMTLDQAKLLHQKLGEVVKTMEDK
jgi:hypothetical protein